jgi:hypothetical protein
MSTKPSTTGTAIPATTGLRILSSVLADMGAAHLSRIAPPAPASRPSTPTVAYLH